MWSPSQNRRILSIGLLAVLSAALGSWLNGGNYGVAPAPGLYMMLTGLWFGVVIGYVVWRWVGDDSLPAAASALLVTWLGWEAAVNVAIQLDGAALSSTSLPNVMKSCLAGLAAGVVGALMTWLAVAMHAPSLRRRRVVLRVVATGAMFGLLLPMTNTFDSGLVLLLPWQVAVAATIAMNLVQQDAGDGAEGLPLATGA